MAPVALPEPKPRARKVFYPERDGKPMAETGIHQQIMMYTIPALQQHYADNPMVYVAGNNFLYYEEGNPKKNVSPDVYVTYGVRHWLRPTYKVWEERGITPSVVIEFTSKSTRKEDATTKYKLYEQILNVDEYFCYDPQGDYLRPRLQGYRLENGRYCTIPLEYGDRLYSRNLDLFLVMLGEDFRFYDPKTGQFLKSAQETQAAYEEEQRLRRLEAERADAETQRVRSAEEEIARLRAELEKLKPSSSAE